MDNRPVTRVRTRFRVVQRTLVIDLGEPHRVLSSAPQGGGYRRAAYILNHQVEVDSRHNGRPPNRFGDPARSLRELASRLGIGAGTVGLMTAVPMTQLVTARLTAGPLWVECFATVGVTNAVRAGEWPPVHAVHNGSMKVGTINLILITNGSFSSAAMTGAVQVVTEAKTGVLLSQGVPSCVSGSAATGTGTDAVVIVGKLQGHGLPQLYSGTHTVLGALLGRVVEHCVVRGLQKAEAWREKQR